MLIHWIQQFLFYLTDGLTNPCMQIFSVTLQFFDISAKSMQSILLDFIKVQTGPGIGRRVSEQLCLRLKSFNIFGKVEASVTDSGADSVKAVQCLMENGKLEAAPPSR